MKIKYFATFVLVITILGLVTVWQHNRVTTLKYRLRELEKQKKEKKEEMNKLKLHTSKFSKPESLIERANVLGIELSEDEEFKTLNIKRMR